MPRRRRCPKTEKTPELSPWRWTQRDAATGRGAWQSIVSSIYAHDAEIAAILDPGSKSGSTKRGCATKIEPSTN